MKRVSYSLLLSALVLGLLAGCSPQFKGATANASPNPLEVHADSVKATVKATIAPKTGFAKNTTYLGNVAVKGADNQSYPMGNVRIAYTDVPNVEQTGASRQFNFATGYNEGMNGGKMIAENKYERKGKTFDLADFDLANCCITTSLLFASGNAADGGAGSGANTRGEMGYRSFPHSFKQAQPVTAEAKFQFPKNVFQIQAGEYKKTDIMAIGEFLKKKYQQTSVTISGFASPEGRFARNQFLSIQRSRNVQKWLGEQLKKEGYQNYLDSTYFKIVTTSEDWDGFKAGLNDTPYSEDVKRQIIEIISAGYDEDEKEAKIMALVGGTNRVEKILAPLRRATIMMNAEMIARTDAQIDSMVTGFLAGRIGADVLKSTFSQEEYLYAVSRTAGAANKAQLLTAYTQAYPDDYRGYNNLGVQQVVNGKLDAAFEAFSAANRKKPSDPAILANLARLQMGRGNTADAAKYAEELSKVQATPVAAYIQGYGAARKGQYAAAAQQFDAAKDEPNAKYNAGLAKLLMNDLAGAKSDLEAAIRENPDRALNYYALAIVGARSGDTNLMVANLKQSVTKDPKMADKATKDLEFRQYNASNEFKAAIAR